MYSALEGWYVDPSTGTNLRFWSGTTWTDEVAPLPDEPKVVGAGDLFENTSSDSVVHEGRIEPAEPVPGEPSVSAPAADDTHEGGLDPDLEATLLTRREQRFRRGSGTALDDTPKHLTSTGPPASKSVEHWLESVEELEIQGEEIPDTTAAGTGPSEADGRPNRTNRVIRMSVLLGILTVATSVAVLTAGSL